MVMSQTLQRLIKTSFCHKGIEPEPDAKANNQSNFLSHGNQRTQANVTEVVLEAMILQGLFLSWMIVFVSGETEMLVNVPPNEELWYWNIKTDSQGAGWIHPSTVKKRYKVCDISDAITKEPKNWLQTDFIDVRSTTQLDIAVTYNLLNCPKMATSKFCKTYFTLYSYHTDTKDPAPDPPKGVFQKETVITPETLPSPGSSVNEVFRGSVVTKAKGIYLAFLDQGVCVTITKVVISYKYCPKTSSTSVTFPRTVAPANDSDLIEQIGKCTDVNSINKVKLSSVCLSNGEWNTTDDVICLCKAGYELVNGTVAPLECKECSYDFYKRSISNSKCLQCPANSTSNAERTACTCDEGFYKLSHVAICKALPQAPLQAKTTVVEETYVVISWHLSPDDDGTLTYALDCFRCKSREGKNCKDACDRQVRYSPGKDNITGVNVTVHGLSSSSFYLFRVYSVSELNQLESDRDKWKYAQVFVETKASTTSVPTTKEIKTATSMYLNIIYGLAGFLIVLITSLACYVIFKRWRLQNIARRNEVPITNQSEIRVYEDIPLPSVVDDDVISDSFKLDRDQITVVRLLGTGNFGQVTKAIYGASRMDVAVKSLKENAQPKDIQDMLSELDVMKSLQPHPHVVRLIGCCTDKDPLLIVVEYLPYGDLLGYLRKSRGVEDSYNTGEKRPNSRLSEKDLLSFAWMIADGMTYLSTMKVVHRDVAARNVLVGEKKVCKISDFGLARELEGDVYTRRTQARLPTKWMPPESLFYGESSTMSDIWSYGIVMWEVFTIGESPYPGFESRQVADLLQTGYRMPRPRHISKELYSIMTECWQEQPDKRPTFQWLCSAVRRLLDDKKIYVNLKEYNDEEYVNFDMINDQE
ncbi:ephrin type-A receptor 4-like isoform X2 [Oculina patagonica]